MKLARMGSLLVPAQYIEHQDAPVDFVRKLQKAFDTTMHVEWNRMKQRWVIEHCVAHRGSDIPNEHGVVIHTHLCQRVYAWLVRDEDTDEYMPLCDRVIEKLQEKETWRKYGTGEAALARFRQESKDFDEAQEAKQRQMIGDIVRQCRKEDRTTWNKFKMLFQRHDMRVNK